MGGLVSWMLVSMIASIVIHGGMSPQQQQQQQHDDYSYVAVVMAQVSDFKPTYMYLLNCGGGGATETNTSANSGVISSDTRLWVGDDSSYLTSPSSSSTTTITITSSSSSLNNTSDPLSTARIFSSTSGGNGVYSFPVTPGRYWIRLYFSDLRQAAQRLNLNLDLASFAVTATANNNNGASSVYTLLFQFNPSGHTQDMVTGNNNIPYLYKEFSVNVLTGPALVLSFIPGTGAASTYAYINAIEVVSMPSGLFPDTTTPVSQGNTLSPQPIGIPYAAMESIYRINVGGPAIDVMNDTSGLYRRWQQGDDDAYLTSPPDSDARQVLSMQLSSVSYTSSLSMYVAPPAVYSTAVLSNFSDTTYPLGVNLSWTLPNVDPSYWYVIRLHFCDLQYTSSGKRVFDVFLQNRTAFRDLDIQVKVRQNQPFYWDFSIPPDTDASAAAAADLLIQAGPRFGSTNVPYNHAIVNGIEVWKLNNSFGSLATFGVQGSGSASSNSVSVGVIVGATVGGCVVLGLLLLGFVCLCRSKRGKLLFQGGKKDATVSTSWGQGNSDPRGRQHLTDYQTYSSSGKPNSNSNSNSTARSSVRGTVHSNGASLVMNGPGRSFAFAEMLAATHNFDESRILGVGGFGKVYLGELTDVNSGTRMVAVKRGSRSSQQGIVEFRTEIDMLSRLRHRHLVSLIGYCEEREEMILVYEYMGNGALRDHLYGRDMARLGGPLTWKQRLDICIGATRGIHYLHTGVSQCIIHRDLKSTNILLDEKLVGKVADFGLSKAGPLIDQTHVSTAVKGSFGYLDPEYFRRQKLTEKSDVYSLGVVLLEVLCARPAINRNLPSEQVNIVEWVMYCKNQGMLEQVIDPYLVGSINLQSLSKYMDTVEKCLADEGVHRPTVGEVLWNLEYCLSLQLQDPNFKDDVLVSMVTAGHAKAQQPLHTSPRPGPGPGPEPVHVVVHSSDQSGNAAEDSSIGTQEDMDDIQMSTLFSQIVNPQGR